MAEETTTEVTGTRKIVLFSIVGVILSMAIIAQFIPENRAYTIEIVKILMTFTQGIIK